MKAAAANTAGPLVLLDRELKPDANWKGCTEVTARAVSMLKTGG